MSYALSVTLTTTCITCFKCGIPFWVDSAWQKTRLNKRDSFWCPNGHEQQYVGKTEAEKLREQLEAQEAELKRAREREDRLSRSRDAFKGQLTKVKRRVANGVCPCCKRSFQDLGRHMAGQHPDWQAQEVG